MPDIDIGARPHGIKGQFEIAFGQLRIIVRNDHNHGPIWNVFQQRLLLKDIPCKVEAQIDIF